MKCIIQRWPLQNQMWLDNGIVHLKCKYETMNGYCQVCSHVYLWRLQIEWRLPYLDLDLEVWPHLDWHWWPHPVFDAERRLPLSPIRQHPGLSESLQHTHLGKWRWGWDFKTSFFNRLQFYCQLDFIVNSWCWSKKQWFCVSCFISLAILRQSCHISYFFPHWKLRGAIGRDIIIGQNNTTLNIEQHLVLHTEHWTLRVIL